MFTGMFSTLILHTSFVFELQHIFSYKSDALLSFDHFAWFYKNMWTKLRCKLLGIHKTDTCIYCITSIFQQSVKFDLNFNKKMFKHAYWFLISLCFLLSMLYIWYIVNYKHHFENEILFEKDWHSPIINMENFFKIIGTATYHM